MTTYILQVPNGRGNWLAARLDWPETPVPEAFAVFAHCFTGSKQLLASAHICRAVVREGFAVLRFDFTGLGESEGDFGQTNFTTNVEDLRAIADYLAREHQAPRLLVGHSLGGTACLRAAAYIPSVQAVATVGSPAEPWHVTKQFSHALGEIDENGFAEVELAGRRFVIHEQFVDDLHDHDMADAIANLGRSLLVLHSPQDTTVRIDNAQAIYKLAQHPKSFVSLAGANHLLTDPKDAAYAGEVIGVWAKRYVLEA